MKWLEETWTMLKETGRRFFSRSPMNFSASIAFYTIFSLPAVLIIMLVVAASVFEEKAVSGELYFQIKEMIGPDSAEQVQKIIQNAAVSESDTFATIVGVVLLCFSATTVFVSLQNGLNSIWSVKAKPAKGWMKYLLDRLLSLGMVISFGFLLLVSLLLAVGLLLFCYCSFRRTVCPGVCHPLWQSHRALQKCGDGGRAGDRSCRLQCTANIAT